MKPEYKFIFDVDGTLYRFDESADLSFTSSRFYADIKQKIYAFLMGRLGLSSDAAQAAYVRLKEKYQGEVSLAVEREYGVDRYEYFEQTWNLQPSDYVASNSQLPIALGPFTDRAAVLSAAPLIWVQATLSYLNIADVFGKRVFTGEPDVRKPKEQAWQQVAEALNTSPQLIFSIGDQEYSDILPAQKLGMKAMLIGKPQNSQPDLVAPDILTAITLLQKEGVL